MGRKTKIESERKEIEAAIEELGTRKIDRDAVTDKVTSIREVIESMRDYEGNEKAINDCLKMIIQKIEYTRRSKNEQFKLHIVLK